MIRKHIGRLIKPRYIAALPMRAVDHVVKMIIKYSSYVLYYPYWLWRKKSIRNGLIWFAVLSALVAEFFGIATLLGLLGVAGQFMFAAMYMVFQFAIMFIFLSSTKNIEMLPGDTGIKSFAKDWYGQEHIKNVVLGTLAMMGQDQKEAMEALGAKPPSGAILTGPPGTGKTLIAQCAASEINIPFIGLNGSDLSAMFIGVGEMKVKSLNAKAHRWANEYGGCVVFIDEIDAATSNRGGVEGSKPQQSSGGMFGGGGQGIRSQLLTAMDGTKEPQIRTDLVNFFHRFFGFEEIHDGVVFWLGATNRLGDVDPAFLRPGRIGDVIIQMDPPDRGSRRMIIQGYVNRITTDDTVDVERLMEDTQGVTPADISGAIERVSARFAIAEGRTAISMSDIEEALLEQTVGVANPILEFDPKQKEQVASHEAGHALISHLLVKWKRITALSIIRRGKGILGYMRDVTTQDVHAQPLEHLMATIQVLWAGDIATDLLLGKRWTGAQMDLQYIENLKVVLANHGVFAGRVPLDKQNPYADPEIYKAAMEYDLAAQVGTRRLLKKYLGTLIALRTELLRKGELNSAEVLEIMGDIRQ